MIHPPKCGRDYVARNGKPATKKGASDSQQRLSTVQPKAPPNVDVKFLPDVDWGKVEGSK